MRAEEVFIEQQGLGYEPSTKSGSTGKSKRDKKEKGKKSKRIQDTPAEKAAYKAKKAAKESKGKVVLEDKKVKYTNFTEAHKIIPEAEINKQRQKDRCTQCSLPGHQWKYCRRPVQVSVFAAQKPNNRNDAGFRHRPYSRRPQVAAVAD